MQQVPTSQGAVIDVSVVVAVYGVERYLPDFLASLDAQVHPHAGVEVVLVDDGSVDGSPALLREWVERTDYDAVVVTQPNAGQSAARNAGLARATRRWVTFPDPDDVLVPTYLREVADRLAEHPDVDLVGCPFVMRYDARDGTLVDDHPLNGRFAGPAQVRRPDEEPKCFFVNPSAGFYPRDRLVELGIEFDSRVRPSFEDGHFGARYLLALDQPRILFVPEAHYHYRKRAEDDSTLSASLEDPRRYVDVVRHGYLDVLRFAQERRGEVPTWLSALVMYDLSWLLRPDTRAVAQTRPALMAVADDFHDLMREITQLIDSEAVSASARIRLPRLWRDVLAHGWDEERWATDWVLVTRWDAEQRLARLVYHYRGDTPHETFVVDGRRVAPAHGTRRPFRILGRIVMYKRIVWVPIIDGLEVCLDGTPVDVRHGGPRRAAPTLVEARVVRQQGARVGGRTPYPRRDPRRVLRRLSRSRAVQRSFADAWVLMDRIHDADDSGERLFEYLRERRPDVNAFFVIQRGTPGWRSLRERYGNRVVAHGSLRWRLLLLSATHLISSHADAGIVCPTAVVRPGEPVPWRFTFLQHGVIKDDLSNWLNSKNLDLFITSTVDEHASVVGDDTNYDYTSREVILSGLPRFDRLRALGGKASAEERNLLLVSPTWRNWLALPLEADSQRRRVTDDFLESEFAQRWLALVGSGRLRSLAEEHGLEIVFLPHPNLQGHLDDVEIPPHVRLSGFDGVDVQQLFAQCRLMVTDYSSMAFNAAYVDRPVVYYQFDRDRMFGGDHVGVGGYFDYERDGFGPVATDHDSIVRAVVDLAVAGLIEPYASRVSATFPERDGRCCERVVAAVESSVRPVVPAFLSDA